MRCERDALRCGKMAGFMAARRFCFLRAVQGIVRRWAARWSGIEKVWVESCCFWSLNLKCVVQVVSIVVFIRKTNIMICMWMESMFFLFI